MPKQHPGGNAYSAEHGAGARARSMRRRSVETGAPNSPATAAVANGTQGRWIAGAALPRRLLWHNSRASFANETLSCMASPRSRLLPQRARFRSQPRARQARRDPVSPFRRRSGRARTWDRLEWPEGRWRTLVRTSAPKRGMSRHPGSMIARVRLPWLEEVRQMSPIGTEEARSRAGRGSAH